MYYQRTYLDKCATIVSGSEVNTGINPVSDLLFGRNLSRYLIHFDHTKIKNLVENKTYPDLSKLKHVLKMTNAGSIDMSELHKTYDSKIDKDAKRRASSFDLIFFLIPEAWDCGKGFDYTKSYENTLFYDKNSYDYANYQVKDGVNWYKPKNGMTWLKTESFKKTKNGLLNFYIKSNKPYICNEGETVTFTYYCECNGNFLNDNLQFSAATQTLDEGIEIGQPIYFAENGQICHTDIQKKKHCTYIQITVTVPESTSSKTKKIPFILKYTIDGVEYTSNPYYIQQLGSDEEFFPSESDGIYSTETLREQYEKYKLGKESVVIGEQHFDIGDENIEVDITDTFNKFISGEYTNYGIGVAYAPDFEDASSSYENYLGILTNKTNTFFEPFVETTYDDVILDDRQNFVLGKQNRLYLYANIGGSLVNLDTLPTCSIDGTEVEVKQATRGIYYVEYCIPIEGNTAPTMHYDTWSNLVYSGQTLQNSELDFTTQTPYSYFGLGTSMPERNAFTPTVYGISDNEVIKRGDVRKLCFSIKQNYTQDTSVVIDGVQARLYIMDGTAQVDVIPYTKTNQTFTDTYIMVDTSILIPQVYYLDVKINYGMESIEHHDVLHFKIVDDTNNKYE